MGSKIRAKLYPFRGKMMTLREIAEETGVTFKYEPVIYKRAQINGVSFADRCSEMANEESAEVEQ